MLTKNEFITMSLDLNLFFLRIMKEHSFASSRKFGGFNKKVLKRA